MFFGREGARGRENLLSTKGFPPPHPACLSCKIPCLTDARQLGAFEHAQQALAADAGTQAHLAGLAVPGHAADDGGFLAVGAVSYTHLDVYKRQLLVWADVLARCVLSGGQELPVGVVTALLGGPFFAFLVRRR